VQLNQIFSAARGRSDGAGTSTHSTQNCAQF